MLIVKRKIAEKRMKKTKNSTHQKLLLIGVILVVTVVFGVGYLSKNSDAKRTQAIETAYPSVLSTYKRESCLAGCTVKKATTQDQQFYAYIQKGSGMPIAKAECFSVDPQLNVQKIGEYPGAAESNPAVTDIDPTTCQGIQ